MIKLHLSNSGTQTITKVCNMCGCHIENLEVEDELKLDLNELYKLNNNWFENYFK